MVIQLDEIKDESVKGFALALGFQEGEKSTHEDYETFINKYYCAHQTATLRSSVMFDKEVIYKQEELRQLIDKKVEESKSKG